MNYSKQRNLIYDMVSSVKTHPTVETVYDEVKKTQSNISLSTVYRNLERLADEQMLLRVKVAGQPDRYDGDITNHYHISCIKCHKIFDVHTEYLKEIDEKISKISGLEIKSHNIIFNTICDKCKIN
ncbi:MAG: transcriptional repressor [Clostridia bacterium]